MAPVKAIRPRVAYADLERMPEDGRRYELYDGEVFVVPSPMPRHQVATHKIGDLFVAYVRSHGGIVLISPIDIVFSEFDVVQPDVVFFSRARAHLVTPDAPIRDTPDVAVEVLSPSTAATDRGKKKQMLARYGMPEYWLVDPRAKTVEICRLADGAYVLEQIASAGDVAHSRTLPGLSFAVDEIFGDW
jgi:Uma2 family endonuclease